MNSGFLQGANNLKSFEFNLSRISERKNDGTISISSKEKIMIVDDDIFAGEDLKKMIQNLQEIEVLEESNGFKVGINRQSSYTKSIMMNCF